MQVECPYLETGPKICTYNGWFCDGTPNCPGGTDEDPTLCKSYTCPSYMVSLWTPSYMVILWPPRSARATRSPYTWSVLGPILPSHKWHWAPK